MQNETQIFPPKEVAMELKRVGFNEPCVGFYIDSHENQSLTPFSATTGMGITKVKSLKNTDIHGSDNACTAPTYDQVIGWFAEVHWIEINTTSSRDLRHYSTTIYGRGSATSLYTGAWVESRQQSLLTAFREAIKLIEK